MKKKKVYLKTAVKHCFYGLGFMFLSFAAASCNNGVDPEKAVDLILSSNTVTLGVGEQKTVNITSGNGKYKVSVTDKTVCTAEESNDIITITGVAAGTVTVSVKDAGDKSAAISVTVKQGVVGENNINTGVKYNMTILDGEKGSTTVWTPTLTNQAKNTTILTRRDYLSEINTEDVDQESVGEYFNYYATDDNTFLCCGYLADGTDPDMGYTMPALLVTDVDDTNNPGCKKITVLTSNIAAAMDWAGYSDKGGSGFYNPTDGSFTIKCAGYLGWGWSFTYHRKYTPVK